MRRREAGLVPFTSRLFLVLSLALLSPFTGVARAQEPTTPLADRAFPYKVLPVEITVSREGVTLPITRVPELRRGDEVRLRVDLEAPEWNSMNSKERQRLRDWSIGWFLTTSQGSLIYDRSNGKGPDRGRIDLAQGQDTITITVDHDRQKFPIFFLVRTRTLESWGMIRQTRETQGANFLDHFGRYSDVLDDYESLRTFLTALERESPQPETVEKRLVTGFEQLGFSVDTKMDLADPKVVGKLLGELEQGISKHGKTFQAQAAGKLLSQMIGDSDLGLIGAAISIGGFLYRSTDYQENYRWSSAKLKDDGQSGRYWVMSSEPIRYGEAEKGDDGSMRNNVRSILVVTPMPTDAPTMPQLNWESDAPNRLVQSSSKRAPEVRSDRSQINGLVQPALVERFVSREAKVWDSIHEDESPLRATVTPAGALEVRGVDKLWSGSEVKAEIKVLGRWGFEPLTLARFTALRSLKDGSDMELRRAPYLLTQGRRYRIDVVSKLPIALSHAVFKGQRLEVEPSVDPAKRGTHYSLSLDPAGVDPGPAELVLYAGTGQKESQRLLGRDFYVAPNGNFHVVLPQGSTTCELVVAGKELNQALADVAVVRLVEGHEFHRVDSSPLFRATAAPTDQALGDSKVVTLLFSDDKKGEIPGVQLDLIPRPTTQDFLLFPPERQGQGYTLDLDSEATHLLERGTTSEFRLVGSAPWKQDTQLKFLIDGAETAGTLSAKETILFGQVTPNRVGPLTYRLSLAIDGTQLRQEWTVPTLWRVVDVPEISAASSDIRGGRLEGSQLDVVISKVFSSEDPEMDPWGSELKRQADGSFRLELPGFDSEQFWVALRDLGDDKRRFWVRRTTKKTQ